MLKIKHSAFVDQEGVYILVYHYYKGGLYRSFEHLRPAITHLLQTGVSIAIHRLSRDLNTQKLFGLQLSSKSIKSTEQIQSNVRRLCHHN